MNSLKRRAAYASNNTRCNYVARFWRWLNGMMLVIAVSSTIAYAQQTNLAVVVRHAPNLNGSSLIEGSVQQLLVGESVTLNGGFTLTGDLFVPGTPTLKVNGNPTFLGTIVGSGSATPTGYQVTLSGTNGGMLASGIWRCVSSNCNRPAA